MGLWAEKVVTGVCWEQKKWPDSEEGAQSSWEAHVEEREQKLRNQRREAKEEEQGQESQNEIEENEE